jgi:hypothetical protein
MATRRTPKPGYLTRLERELAHLNAERHRIIKEIEVVVKQLTYGFYAPMSGLLNCPGGKKGSQTGRRPGFTMSASARKKISGTAAAEFAATIACEGMGRECDREDAEAPVWTLSLMFQVAATLTDY